MNLTTFTSRTGAALVAGVAGFASYQHIYDVAKHAGEHVSVASVLPLAIDGLIVVASAAMLDDKHNGRQARPSARFALAFGILATIAANVASAAPGATARMVAAVPAVSFLLAVEVLSRVGKPLPVQRVKPAQVVEPEPVPEPVEQIAAEPVRPEPVQRVMPRSLTAEQRVIAAHEKEPEATHERIAELAKCSVATVKRHRPKRPVSGSPSGQGAAETAPVEQVNGRQPTLL